MLAHHPCKQFKAGNFGSIGTGVQIDTVSEGGAVCDDDANTMVQGLRQKGHQIFCAGLDETAIPITECDFTKPSAIVFGNEHRGVDPEIMELVPDRIYIPMRGMIQSLNVSVAAAVFLYEAWRQRTAKGMYADPSFEPEALEAMVRDWCER